MHVVMRRSSSPAWSWVLQVGMLARIDPWRLCRVVFVARVGRGGKASFGISNTVDGRFS